MGSVKDLTVLEKASEHKEGLGIFKFSDRYSVFDYGEMPDLIPKKGAALCKMASYNFEQLEKQGMYSHFIEQVSETEMKVKLVRVLDPAKNELPQNPKNCLVPLEIIFRNSLPEGSSLLKRFHSGQVKPENFGLNSIPNPGEKLSEPILDVSTKLEDHDRYLSWKEAKELAKLSETQLAQLKYFAGEVNEFITERAEKIGLEHADGKIEFGLDAEGKLMLLDVLGTLDENRFLFNGIHISKQVLRDYYKTLPWYQEYVEKGTDVKPPHLPKELILIVSEMYQSVCNAWCHEHVFNVPQFKEVLKQYQEFLQQSK
ncbi:MAG: phosphoribosylaminoimidazolesuccinocarboxamide synthase [Candidatus Diapherotrites archaeon]|nr:phosphoribosylaminoimidazolesuccinocarboxamide synthase [Candidatus Diapherotrites archaeon]